MLILSLDILKKLIEKHLQENDKLNGFTPKVLLGNIANGVGENPGMIPKDCICLTVLNINEIRALKNSTPGFMLNKSNEIQETTGLELEHDILVSSTYTEYEVAIMMLYETLIFLKNKSVFTLDDLPSELLHELHSLSNILMYEKCKFRMMFRNNSIEESKTIWDMLKSRMLPSALFRLQILESQKKND